MYKKQTPRLFFLFRVIVYEFCFLILRYVRKNLVIHLLMKYLKNIFNARNSDIIFVVYKDRKMNVNTS